VPAKDVKTGPGCPKLEVCLEVDSNRFLEMFLSRLGSGFEV